MDWADFENAEQHVSETNRLTMSINISTLVSDHFDYKFPFDTIQQLIDRVAADGTLAQFNPTYADGYEGTPDAAYPFRSGTLMPTGFVYGKGNYRVKWDEATTSLIAIPYGQYEVQRQLDAITGDMVVENNVATVSRAGSAGTAESLNGATVGNADPVNNIINEANLNARLETLAAQMRATYIRSGYAVESILGEPDQPARKGRYARLYNEAVNVDSDGVESTSPGRVESWTGTVPLDGGTRYSLTKKLDGSYYLTSTDALIGTTAQEIFDFGHANSVYSFIVLDAGNNSYADVWTQNVGGAREFRQNTLQDWLEKGMAVYWQDAESLSSYHYPEGAVEGVTEPQAGVPASTLVELVEERAHLVEGMLFNVDPTDTDDSDWMEYSVNDTGFRAQPRGTSLWSQIEGRPLTDGEFAELKSKIINQTVAYRIDIVGLQTQINSNDDELDALTNRVATVESQRLSEITNGSGGGANLVKEGGASGQTAALKGIKLEGGLQEGASTNSDIVISGAAIEAKADNAAAAAQTAQSRADEAHTKVDELIDDEATDNTHALSAQFILEQLAGKMANTPEAFMALFGLLTCEQRGAIMDAALPCATMTSVQVSENGARVSMPAAIVASTVA